ncbi:hypothetical protein [Sutcliffiella horikoshii]|uniref:hypothetical protein n=1 Tax=Sutcliffiella horikoshii TaxID=79883 RepID=UPI001CFD5C4E|nr:hypothetical protein [Sutcliffiella horikoshii]
MTRKKKERSPHQLYEDMNDEGNGIERSSPVLSPSSRRRLRAFHSNQQLEITSNQQVL